MRLYFFPALLPFSALLPGLLALVGAFAAFYQKLMKRRKLAWALGIGSFLLLLFLAGSYFRQYYLKTQLPSLQLIETLPRLDAKISWNQLLPRAPLSNLVYTGQFKLVLFGTRQKTLDAVSTEDGTLRFSLQMSEPVLSEPLVLDQDAFVGEGLHDALKSRMVALELPSGQPRWQYAVNGHIESTPRVSIDEERIFFCAGDSGVFALSRKTGGLLWNTQLGHCDTTPFLERGVLYVLASGAKVEQSALTAMDENTGKALWTLPLPGQPWGTPMRDEVTGNLLLSTGAGQLDFPIKAEEQGWAHAIDTQSRQVVWTKILGGMPLLKQGLLRRKQGTLVIQTLKNGKINALDFASGREVWSVDLGAPVLAVPVLGQDGTSLVAVDFAGRVSTIDGKTGRLRFAQDLGFETTSSPVLGAGKVFLGTRAAVWGLNWPLAEVEQ
ncbi:MAG TPA: hypothetical protein DCS07_16255 [Bdellovibrionales bacterium]|nr:hypothetical protein [Bdellovibrionales bacterium]